MTEPGTSGTTWDGLAITDDEPAGATIVVRRPDGDILLLHRAHYGPDHAGDWAWTPPAGSRQPGEPIHPAALRELAEEAGLTGIDIIPIDLSGRWAAFIAEVGADTPVELVDPEHDRFEWVRPAEAYTRCLPLIVGDGVRRVCAVPSHGVAFRPLTHADRPALVTWQTAAHVARWWTDPVRDVADAEAKYGPRVDGRSATRVDVLLVDGRPAGFIQTTPLSADPDYQAVAAPHTAGADDTVAVDYAIGEPDLVGRGIGTRMLWTYLRTVVFDRHPDVRYVVADPDIANTASVRALEKAGFRRVDDFEPEPGAPPHTLCVLDRSRVFGR